MGSSSMRGHTVPLGRGRGRGQARGSAVAAAAQGQGGLLVVGNGHFRFTEDDDGNLVTQPIKERNNPPLRRTTLPTAWNPHKQKQKAIEKRIRAAGTPPPPHSSSSREDAYGRGDGGLGESGDVSFSGEMEWEPEDKQALRLRIEEERERFGSNYHAPRHLVYAGISASSSANENEPPAADYTSHVQLEVSGDPSQGLRESATGKSLFPSPGDILAIRFVELINWAPKLTGFEECTVVSYDVDNLCLNLTRPGGQQEEKQISSLAEIRLVQKAPTRSIPPPDDRSDILRQLRLKREALRKAAKT